MTEIAINLFTGFQNNNLDWNPVEKLHRWEKLFKIFLKRKNPCWRTSKIGKDLRGF